MRYPIYNITDSDMFLIPWSSIYYIDSIYVVPTDEVSLSDTGCLSLNGWQGLETRQNSLHSQGNILERCGKKDGYYCRDVPTLVTAWPVVVGTNQLKTKINTSFAGLVYHKIGSKRSKFGWDWWIKKPPIRKMLGTSIALLVLSVEYCSHRNCTILVQQYLSLLFIHHHPLLA